MNQLSLLTPSSDYHPLPNTWDEMWDTRSGVRPHWAHLVKGMTRFGAREWTERGQRITRLLRENGVTYHVYDDPRGNSRTWELDPIPLVLDGNEWLVIAAGLDQRARLLDLLLRDLYGAQSVLKNGLLPPELVFGHAGYLRPMLGALSASPAGERRQLVLYAADLARGPDGRVWVVADRTQSPSGAGYALENRAVMARTFPELLEGAGVAKLTHWLKAVQAALVKLSPREQPHVALLSPGPANETYFEHAYLAARLGYTLAQGDDLTVRDGRVWLKAVSGLKPVDVILRRLDEEWCDPLELRQDSRLGTAGLIEALRRGTVAMANPPGSGLLENPALLPFLPRLARMLLGEDLALPTAATWWCGQEKECEYVLANLPRLVLKPIARGQASETVLGANLDRRQLATWRARIRARPHLYVGQQPMSLSSVPALRDHRLAPQHMSLRAFLVSQGDGYVAMPGGLTRCGDGAFLSSQSGALSKDTWVTPAPPKAIPSSVLLGAGNPAETEILTSRAADNLFWAGRYLERAEGVARLLRALLDGLWEEETTPGQVPVLTALMRMVGYQPASRDLLEQADFPATLAAEVHDLITHKDHPGNLAHTVRALLACTYSTREYWSVAIWRLLDRIERDWSKRRRNRGHERSDLWLGHLIDTLAGLAGLASETLPRADAFRFFDLGRRIERGLTASSVLTCILESRLTDEAQRESLSLVLQSADSLVTFRRRYRGEPFLAGVLELLLWDTDSPRALVFQLNTARLHLGEIARPLQHCEARHLLRDVEERLLANASRVTDPHLDREKRVQLIQILNEVSATLGTASGAITQTWFTHVQELHTLNAGGVQS
ncbi:MAG: circularly permuted type 2 ATP-grasp protein [Gallionellaceae bacterium]|nr:circularly permuted type 2 ATP-grasp protein [Gallionellaceae bacterium]